MHKPYQITITDIANQLGVSPSTVSRALRDHPSISVGTKKKVLAIAEKYRYQPNLLALSLLKKRTGIIGIVVPEITGHFFATVISGVQDMVGKAGYKLLICQSNESFDEESKLLQDILALRVDGVLISPTYETADYTCFEALQSAGIPLVIFDRDCSGFEADKVLVDSYEGAYNAVEYLIKKGYENIAHIAGPISFPTFKQRLDGYLNAHYDNNLPISSDSIIKSSGFSSDAGVEAVDQILGRKKKVDAIFAVNDAVAIGAMFALRERGYRVPEDIAIIGFDDEPYAQHFHPTLSSVWQPAYELGMLSAKILLDRHGEKDAIGSYRHEVLKPELMIRASS